jgi:hypothetical protein
MDGDYQAKTLVTAFISDVKDVEYNKKGTPGQSLYLRHEGTGEISWVKFTGNDVKDNPLTKDDKGTTRDFKIWPFKPKDSPNTYLYCWIQRQTSQQSQQGTQQATQQPNTLQGNQSPAQDVRAKALYIAARLVAAGIHKEVMIYGLADCIVDYIQTGKHPTGVANANPPEEQMPWDGQE